MINRDLGGKKRGRYKLSFLKMIEDCLSFVLSLLIE